MVTRAGLQGDRGRAAWKQGQGCMMTEAGLHGNRGRARVMTGAGMGKAPHFDGKIMHTV